MDRPRWKKHSITTREDADTSLGQSEVDRTAIGSIRSVDTHLMALLQRIHRRQVLPTTLQQAWSFFSSPMNLQELTPPEMAFEVLSEPPARIYPG